MYMSFFFFFLFFVFFFFFERESQYHHPYCTLSLVIDNDLNLQHRDDAGLLNTFKHYPLSSLAIHISL